MDALVAAAERGLEVYPTPRSVRMIQDREGLRKLAADELGLPTAPFWFAGSAEELTAVAQHAGFPLVVKPTAAAPGDGQSVLLRVDDIEPAWHRAVAAGRIPNRVMAETVVDGALTISKAAELLHRKETNYDSIAGVCDDRTSHNVATVQ